MEKTDKKTAQNIAETIPCACSDCGMNESRAAQMIQEYAAQELADYKERLKKHIKTIRDNGYAAQQLSEYKEYFKLAEKAKQILREKGYGWTGLNILETCKLVPKAESPESTQSPHQPE